MQLTRLTHHAGHVIPVTSTTPNSHTRHDPGRRRIPRSGQLNRNTNHPEHGNCKNKALLQ